MTPLYSIVTAPAPGQIPLDQRKVRAPSESEARKLVLERAKRAGKPETIVVSVRKLGA